MSEPGQGEGCGQVSLFQVNLMRSEDWEYLPESNDTKNQQQDALVIK